LTAYILPNVPSWFKKKKCKISNCIHCGAPAKVGGRPHFEWWKHYVKCSANCSESEEVSSQGYSLLYLVDKWNEKNLADAEETND
jgi:hypothetical protein